MCAKVFLLRQYVYVFRCDMYWHMYENGKTCAKVEKSQKPPYFMSEIVKNGGILRFLERFFIKNRRAPFSALFFGVFLCINILNLLGVLYKIWWTTVLCKKGHIL